MQKSQSRRKHERVWHKIPASVTTQSGVIACGTTRDLSIRGALIEVENLPVTVVCGEQGTVQLDLPGISDKVFTCVIAHVNSINVGIHILNPSENFGFFLSQALFAELQQPETKVTDLDWSVVQVSIHKPAVSALNGKMLRLTSDWIEFCCFLGNQSQFNIGEEVVVHLTIPDTDTYIETEILKIRGFVTEPLQLMGPKIGCLHGEILKKVAFASGPMENVERLIRLIRRVHTPRITAIIKNRALTNALLAGEESVSQSRQDTMNNIKRFFSYLWRGP